jgi:hypothetical protein
VNIPAHEISVCDHLSYLCGCYVDVPLPEECLQLVCIDEIALNTTRARIKLVFHLLASPRRTTMHNLHCLCLVP